MMMKTITIEAFMAFVLLSVNVQGKCQGLPRVKSAMLNRESRTSFKEGEYLQHTCKPGFDSVADIKTYCSSGKWSEPRFGCNKCYGHWTLIFRAMSKIGGEPTEIYMNSDIASEKNRNVPSACSSRSTRGHCRYHYRSSIIDDWGLLKIKKVKIELLSHSGHVAHVVFNGDGTTSTNWFDKRRIISSSFIDIQSKTSNIFSIFGDLISGNRMRRWMMNHIYNGCNGDSGWVIAIEKQGPCPIDKQRNYPVFFYSPYSYVGNFNQYKEADLMAIYIEADGLCA